MFALGSSWSPRILQCSTEGRHGSPAAFPRFYWPFLSFASSPIVQVCESFRKPGRLRSHTRGSAALHLRRPKSNPCQMHHHVCHSKHKRAGLHGQELAAVVDHGRWPPSRCSSPRLSADMQYGFEPIPVSCNRAKEIQSVNRPRVDQMSV